jgi:hypothetical protein
MELDEQNRQVVFLVQAMLGMVTPNLRGASVVFEPDLALHFVLEEDSELDRDEIEDAMFEFIAFQDQPVDVKTVIVVSTAPMNNLLLPGRRVYMRHEPVE